jgi:hypothetical protein
MSQPLPSPSTTKRLARDLVIQPVREAARAAIPASFPFGYPKGGFSALQLLQQGHLRGRQILETQGAPDVSADSMMVRSGLTQHLQQPWPIFWTLHENSRLIGESLAHLDQNNSLCIEACYGSSRYKSDPAYNTFFAGPPQRLAGNWTSLVSKWSPASERMIYAHWLFDALPRLALLNEFPSDTRILVPRNIAPFQRQALEHLSLWERCRPISQTWLELERYYFSSPPTMIVCYSPYAVKFLRDKFLSLGASNKTFPRRFYLTRKNATIRSAKNEDEVAQFFEKIGWTVVDPASLSFADQIALFANAEAIFGIHGSAFANLVWCSPGATAVEIFADRFLSGCYEWLAQTVAVRHRFLVFPGDEQLNAIVDLRKIEQTLAELNL